MTKKKLWRGLASGAADALSVRDYRELSPGERLATIGVDAGEIVSIDRNELDWIPGVEIFARAVHSQHHRGLFAEMGRENEGIFGQLKIWPRQWATARMFANTAKGFHVHPPFVPEGADAAKLIQKRFGSKAGGTIEFEREQWDAMYFVQGRVEMILREVRAGLPAKTMRFFIDGDNHRSRNNVGVVVPPGVAHALRVEGSEDVIMVYGTSTPFRPEFEGRIASDVESAQLPESWQSFLAE